MGSSEPLALVQLPGGLLGGSWVVISRVISPLIGVITIVTLVITPLITTREPPSRSSESLNPDHPKLRTSYSKPHKVRGLGD